MRNSKKCIYLDSAATTPIDPAVIAVVRDAEEEFFANPHSQHQLGKQAHQAVEVARSQIQQLLDASGFEIVFTSGGTEANNLAIHGLSRKAAPSIFASSTEHPSVREPVSQLERKGRIVRWIPVDQNGAIRSHLFEDFLSCGPALATVQTVNSETGVIQDIPTLAEIAHRQGATLHTDAVQVLGKIPFSARKNGADLISLSAHKFFGPKGIGILLIREGLVLNPLVHGGGQESGLRSGTLNVPAILGMAKALDLAVSHDLTLTERLRDSFETQVLANFPEAVINGFEGRRCAAISNISFPFMDDIFLQTRLQQLGLCVSSGSACSSSRQEPSAVLLTMGYSHHHAKCSVRFSFSRTNTEDDITECLHILTQVLGPFC